MTAVTDTITILETLAGKSLANTQMLNVVENFINYQDEQGFTNEEKAQEFLDKTLTFIKNRAKAGASNKAVADNYAVVTAAAEAAVVDLI